MGQNDQCRPQNAPKQAKMDKNGQSWSKTYFSDAAVPPCSHAAMHTFCRHVRTFPGCFVVVSTNFIIFLTYFKAFLGHFWPFLAFFGMPCCGHFWRRVEIFRKFFRFWPSPQPSLCKKTNFFERSRVSKISSKKVGPLWIPSH